MEFLIKKAGRGQKIATRLIYDFMEAMNLGAIVYMLMENPEPLHFFAFVL